MRGDPKSQFAFPLLFPCGPCSKQVSSPTSSHSSPLHPMPLTPSDPRTCRGPPTSCLPHATLGAGLSRGSLDLAPSLCVQLRVSRGWHSQRHPLGTALRAWQLGRGWLACGKQAALKWGADWARPAPHLKEGLGDLADGSDSCLPASLHCLALSSLPYLPLLSCCLSVCLCLCLPCFCLQLISLVTFAFSSPVLAGPLLSRPFVTSPSLVL